jgi:ADP-heptose:LPS heptosyltransferase
VHLLLVRFSSMGDVVLQTATINWLKSLYGAHIKISFLTSKEFASLIEGYPYVDEVITFDRRKEQWSDLKKKVSALHTKNKIDLIVDLHATTRSWRLRQSFWSIPALVVDKRRVERFLLTKIKWPFFKKIFSLPMFGMEQQVERIIYDWKDIFGEGDNISVVRRFLGTDFGLKQISFLKKEKNSPHPKPYLVVAPAASFAPKRWPIERFVELVDKILNEESLNEYDVVVLAGPSDNYCEALNTISNPRLFNLQGKTSLSESMSYLAHATLCVGNDSGMNHIAEAYGHPAITIFGPTDERFGFAPHGVYSEAISVPLWCRPCSTTGKKTCFRDKQYCMLEISAQRVLDSVKNSLLKMGKT